MLKNNRTAFVQKEFNILLDSSLVLNRNEIVKENASAFTVKMQVVGFNISFLNIESDNKAPVVDTNKDDENDGIDIGKPDTDVENGNNGETFGREGAEDIDFAVSDGKDCVEPAHC